MRVRILFETSWRKKVRRIRAEVFWVGSAERDRGLYYKLLLRILDRASSANCSAITVTSQPSAGLPFSHIVLAFISADKALLFTANYYLGLKYSNMNDIA